MYAESSISGEYPSDQAESVDALQRHLHDTFHYRNEAYLPGRMPRLELFQNGIHDLVAALRVDDASLAATALARLGSRIFCITDALSGVQLSEGLEAKFPEYGCLFCKHSPCVCSETRATPAVTWPPERSRTQWSLSDWQASLWSTYGSANTRRGIESVALRLYAESGELGTVENQIQRGIIKIDEIAPAYAMGAADLAAWTLAVGSMRRIDVQQAIVERYANGCVTCGCAVCHCGPSEFDHVYPSLD